MKWQVYRMRQLRKRILFLEGRRSWWIPAPLRKRRLERLRRELRDLADRSDWTRTCQVIF